MTDANMNLNDRPAWVDLASDDAAASRDFYGKLLGWDVQVDPNPLYGGYGMASENGVGIAGIGAKMNPATPTAWSLYIGTDDADALAQKVASAGGTVVMAPFDIGDQGRMAVFQDPAGAYFSAYQAVGMRGFISGKSNSFGWAELNARGVDSVLPFYEQVFGWTVTKSPMGENMPPYNEFHLGDESILGAWEMSPMVPAQVPSYWQIYFNVDDVDAAFAKARELGATEMLAPRDYPGGRFAIMMDPQGAGFGLITNRG